MHISTVQQQRHMQATAKYQAYAIKMVRKIPMT